MGAVVVREGRFWLGAAEVAPLRATATTTVGLPGRVKANLAAMMTLTVSAARADLPQIIDSATSTHERFEVTQNGQRTAMILGASDYGQLLESLDVLSDDAALSDICELPGAWADMTGQAAASEILRERATRDEK